MKYVIVLLLSSLFFSCSTLQPIPHNPEREVLPNLQGKNLSGKFEIKGLGNAGYLDSYLLIEGGYFDYKNPPDSNDYLKIEEVSYEKIKISIYDDDILVKEKTLKGEMDNSYFQFRPWFRIHFFTVVFNATSSLTTRIGLLKNGNLILDSEESSSGFLVVMPIVGSEGKKYDLEFSKID